MLCSALKEGKTRVLLSAERASGQEVVSQWLESDRTARIRQGSMSPAVVREAEDRTVWTQEEQIGPSR